ncbi:MAG: Holliday junction resolvase RuvX [Bacteroidetes bacterium]|nr:Holliday junction resolvase RuvX [Rhodothermia bacterium]MCX7906518.1 Holliday junction resolvase RuvX [Bacteroidota bacterium]MDW8284929.1 Holliday junction resolvase RuvX [Bacteroidota bacterium]
MSLSPIMALDYGRKRVGLAISDRMRLVARPLGTYAQEEALRVLLEQVRREAVAVLVVGWPLDMRGQPQEMAREVAAYMRRIKHLAPELELVRWDERLSTVRAQQMLREGGVKRKNRQNKARLDQAAAALLLQEYLDFLRLCPQQDGTSSSP